jgi:proteasome lid subunit RPN8/RPN11
MTATHQPLRRRSRGQPRLTFAPLAWLKLKYFCHAADTEIAGFGISAKDDPLYIEEFVTVRQRACPVTVSMDDTAVADFVDRCVDAGLPPARFLRLWIHTHPASSAEPSHTDENTFARVFGTCDWAVMFILSRTGNTYARLSFSVGPGGAVQLPVMVDWSAWPGIVNDPVFSMANCFAEWQKEFTTNILPIPPTLQLFSPPLPTHPSIAAASPWEPFADAWDWDDFDQELLEDLERHERTLNDDRRA